MLDTGFGLVQLGYRHRVGTGCGGSGAGTLERMFAAVDEVVDEALAVRREGRRRELVSIFAEQARLAQRVTQIVREADDDA